ncbi:vanadium-dependent haloperoxidase [Streptomyces sp. TP-A0356]|uniref:vanadium-dependent haloperoxidase n=1 Tax=Streptomyces sp. TP-A0356 TaxID=1359208 RepID=UPI000B20592E|nr:vanadium-dependent haloperoxidase [Streptomyces sp. TP-A0356]
MTDIMPPLVITDEERNVVALEPKYGRRSAAKSVPAPLKPRAGRRLGQLGAAVVAGTLLTGLSPGAAGAQPAAAAAPNHSDDPTQYWNKVLLQTFRDARGMNAAPGKLTRAAAMTYAAIYNAESAYQYTYGTMKYQPYLNRPLKYAARPPRRRPDEEERVIDRTAYRIISQLFPGDRAYIDAQFIARTGYAPNSYDILDHLVVDPVVRQINDARWGDGSDNTQVYSGDTTTPGAWRPTGGACRQPSDAVTPNWGLVKPFVLRSGSQFRPATMATFASYADLLASPAYAGQVEEVRRLGAVNSTERTVDQTAAAWFWANDLDGTYKPPGQLLQMTGIVANEHRLDKYQTARLYALVSLTMADAVIAVWDTKYDTPIKLWRPVTAIQAMGGANATWQPLSADRSGAPFTPCFPAWSSGHAGLAGAWAGAMKRFFGRDDVSFSARSEDPHTHMAYRSFTSFSQAAREDAMSRIWLGVHYRWDVTDGLAIGDHVADYLFANTMLPTRPGRPPRR